MMVRLIYLKRVIEGLMDALLFGVLKSLEQRISRFLSYLLILRLLRGGLQFSIWFFILVLSLPLLNLRIFVYFHSDLAIVLSVSSLFDHWNVLVKLLCNFFMYYFSHWLIIQSALKPQLETALFKNSLQSFALKLGFRELVEHILFAREVIVESMWHSINVLPLVFLWFHFGGFTHWSCLSLYLKLW